MLLSYLFDFIFVIVVLCFYGGKNPGGTGTPSGATPPNHSCPTSGQNGDVGYGPSP